MAKYRLLAGGHMGPAPEHLPKVRKVGPDGQPEKGPDGKVVMEPNPYHVYRQGETVETDDDLLLLNTPGQSDKFELVGGRPFVTGGQGRLGQAPVAQALPPTPSNADPEAARRQAETGTPALTNAAPVAGGQVSDPGKVTTETAAEQKAVVGENKPSAGSTPTRAPTDDGEDAEDDDPAPGKPVQPKSAAGGTPRPGPHRGR